MKKAEIDLIIQRACLDRGLSKEKFIDGGAGYFQRHGCFSKFVIPQVNIRSGAVLLTGYTGVEIRYVNKNELKSVVFVAELSNFLVEFPLLSRKILNNGVDELVIREWIAMICELMNSFPGTFAQLNLALRGGSEWRYAIRHLVDKHNMRLQSDYEALEEYASKISDNKFPRWGEIAYFEG